MRFTCEKAHMLSVGVAGTLIFEFPTLNGEFNGGLRFCRRIWWGLYPLQPPKIPASTIIGLVAFRVLSHIHGGLINVHV